MPARLCLNMIVKNEAAIIDRCLVSVAPYLAHAVICDTGSTDDTRRRIRETLSQFGVSVELHAIPFANFAQARNDALQRARDSSEAFDYILLADADMELRVSEPGFRTGLTSAAYQLRQENALSYFNVRLVRRDVDARYVGATHEYLDVAGAVERLHGVWFADHADGANRPEKFERDIRLLTTELEAEPDNIRAMFYLAQSLKDAGRPAEAIPWYRRRIEAGGWEEERWYARFMLALCHLRLGERDAFVARALEAYDARPWRTEPLIHLARFYRESGQHEAAMAIAETARAIPYPADDILFIEKDAYSVDLAHEVSISGFYCAAPERKRAGRDACFGLTTQRNASLSVRSRAISNARFYAGPLAEVCPSFVPQRIEMSIAHVWHPMNPSIAVWKDTLHLNIRTVNYVIRPDGTYDISDPEGVVRTTNLTATLNDDLAVTDTVPLDERNDPGPVFPSLVVGFEDGRLFVWRGTPWLLATSRDRNATTMNMMVLLELSDHFEVVRVLPLSSPEPHLPQKNWMPAVLGEELRLIYQCDPTVVLRVDPRDGDVSITDRSIPPVALDHLRGGSQLIPVGEGWLAVTHEVSADEGGRRTYLHRFVGFDQGLHVDRISDPFYLVRLGYEFCAGMTIHPRTGKLVVSFGVDDREAWLGELALTDVLSLLRPI